MSIQSDRTKHAVTVQRPFEDPIEENAILRKVSLRLLPFIFVLYVLNILDRNNVGFARLQMLDQLKMSERVYGLGASIFFLGYFLFEVPSNLMLKRLGARRWITRILISWGIISASMMFVVGPWSFYSLRFLLGLAEAGFFPGIILYLSYWFPTRQRARAVSRFMIGSAVTGIVGGPLSGCILQYMDKVAGLAGWQWLFLLEGLPTVVLGFVALYYLTDCPEHAHWLTPKERDWLSERMRQEERHRQLKHGLSLLQTMANPRVWLLCALYFTVSMGSNSYGVYLPQVLRDRFPDSPESVIGLLAALPSIAAIICMVLIAMHSDHTGERRWHVAVPALLAATGWVVVACAEGPWLVLAGLALAHLGMLSMLAPFWSLPTSFLSGAAAAGGIAMINSIGNLGGFVGPNVIGALKTSSNSFSPGFLCLALTLVIGAILAICARHDSASEQVGPDAASRNEEV